MQRMDIERVRTALKMLTPEEWAIIQDFFFTESTVPGKEFMENTECLSRASIEKGMMH